MTEPTWTPWLDNPGTGENPVPEFAVEFEVMLFGKNDTYVNGCWDCSSTPEGAIPVTRYRYSIPADLAWLAKNVIEWKADDGSREYTHIVKNASNPGFGFGWGMVGTGWYTKTQWLRARQDLGYELGKEAHGVNDCITTKDRQQQLEALKLARVFHDTYERLAPEFGYTTRKSTRKFDPHSSNGQLMVAVCKKILNSTPVPEGWQLVPVEPTQEMLIASEGWREYDVPDHWMNCNEVRRVYGSYRAMLSAAPTPEDSHD